MKALKPSTSIQFDLLSNAADSLQYAIELLAWNDIASDQRRMKQAIMAVAHGVELLLKERLRQVQPALIWEDVACRRARWGSNLHCGQWAIPDAERSCLLCGHWNAGSDGVPE